MAVLDVLSVVFILAGVFFFVAGTVGLLRFPDLYTRLHAVTKADNLGLGLVIVGVALHAGSWLGAAKLALTWLLVLAALAVSGHLIANAGRQEGVEPWRKPG